MAKSKKEKVSSSAVRWSIKKKEDQRNIGNEVKTENKEQVRTHWTALCGSHDGNWPPFFNLLFIS